MDHQPQLNIVPRPQKETFDEEAAFSFRRQAPKKQPRSRSQHLDPDTHSISEHSLLSSSSSPPSALTPASPRPRAEGAAQTPSGGVSQDISAIAPSASSESILYSSAATVTSNPFQDELQSQQQQQEEEEEEEEEQVESGSEWRLVWCGSWIVPSLEPMSLSSATTKPISSSTSRKTLGLQKKASLDVQQQIVFQGRDGAKLQPTVTELSGIAFAISQPQAPALSESLGPSAQIMRENTEMHLIAKIRLSSFPVCLLMPGCTEPCRVFTSPENKASATCLQELFDHDDIDEMTTRCRAGDGTAVGQIGLLLRLASKPGLNQKRKGMLAGHLRQDDNPFLQPSRHGHGGSSASTKPTSDQGKKDGLPTMSFFAYPLVDQARFSEEVQLNVRAVDRLRQDAEEAHKTDLARPAETGKHVIYEDPDVDSIMNGGDGDGQDSVYRSEWSLSVDMDVDGLVDASLRQEMEMLEALERSKTWSPYTVMTPPAAPLSTTGTHHTSTNSKDASKDRILSRSQTFVDIKDRSARMPGTWGRHRSMDSHGGITASNTTHSVTATANSIAATTKATISAMASTTTARATIAPRTIRKEPSRRKSPSRAPQQPLDVTTESLRRKLLGPGLTRTELPSISSISSTVSATKSVEARNKATVKSLTSATLSKINIAPDHEDFKECASNLYRSVTFAMRKDIGKRRYHLEELERLMDRHAALL
ncbi:hypothetical protein BGZ98_002938 [Dissophora globulifera]|nr:hypothetical protein BGZ98_002938 [Dissophora globulifera]